MIFPSFPAICLPFPKVRFRHFPQNIYNISVILYKLCGKILQSRRKIKRPAYNYHSVRTRKCSSS